jgi:chemotaxis response regulator CheB
VTRHHADSDGSRLRVLVAEDQYLMREGTRRLLAEVPGIDVVGEACDYDSVLAECRRLEPDVVLMDIKMPPTHSMEGIEAAHVLKRERPDLGVVVLSQHEDEGYVWALLESGVAGYGYLHKVRVGDVDQSSGRCVRSPPAARCSTPGSCRRSSTDARRSRARCCPTSPPVSWTS